MQPVNAVVCEYDVPTFPLSNVPVTNVASEPTNLIIASGLTTSAPNKIFPSRT